MSKPTLVVFSHLRWGFVYQRPQHLLSRLASKWNIYFIEEPMHTDGPARLEERHPLPNLTVVVPHTPVTLPGFHDEQLSILEPMISAYIAQQKIKQAITWLYTPMALPLAKTVPSKFVMYDCMDELSAFKGAPVQLRQRESALMKRAALVLTGGPSLYRAKRNLHSNAHCLPSAVDPAHFSPTNLHLHSQTAAQVEAIQGNLRQPRVGYYGVIDERLDIELVGMVADAHPEWDIAMVGPVVKIDPQSLPQRPNIHWLGMQSYDRLPYFLAGWDLCLMPFALNESTQFISPTKTLEYMAGGKPVVSTPIRDVISLYGHVVSVAPRGEAFVKACETLLAESPVQRARRQMEMLSTVTLSSWDRCAQNVHRLISSTLEEVEGTAIAEIPSSSIGIPLAGAI